MTNFNKKGRTLDNKAAHDAMHKTWSRRQFLTTAGISGLGSVLLQGLPFSASAALSSFQPQNDRILVLIKLNGGNDGLNTIIPENQIGAYKSIRRPIRVVDNKRRSLSDSHHSIPREMEVLKNLWDEGNMGVIHNVNYLPYNNANIQRSHFVRTATWESGHHHNYDNLGESGWAGRFLQTAMGGLSESLPSKPMAINLGNYNNLSFKSADLGPLELSFRDAKEFYELVGSGSFYTLGGGSCQAARHQDFIRQVTNTALKYGSVVEKAYQKGINQTNYNTTTVNEGKELARQLAIIARLIKGGLGTPIYHASINGFDTHSSQVYRQAGLLGDTANSIYAFYNDLKRQGWQDKVVVMVYSEFGRTLRSNSPLPGSGIDFNAGTDHGEGNVVMLFGDAINGGMYGDTPDLQRLDNLGKNYILPYDTNGNLIESEINQFQSIYASILDNWFCQNSVITDAVLRDPSGLSADPFPRISNLFSSSCNASTQFGNAQNALILGYNQQKDNQQFVEIKYAVLQPGEITLKLSKGNNEWQLFKNNHPKAGSFTYVLDQNQYPLLTGECTCTIYAEGQTANRLIQLF